MPGKHLRRLRTNAWFVGVDGEGGNIPDPDALFGTKHVYQLLRAGEHVVENPTGLTFNECAEFLCSLSPHNLYVAFAFNYDVTMMIKDLPEGRVKRLYDIKARTPKIGNRIPWPVDIDDTYQIDYIPSKFFKIRKRKADGSWPEFITIFDVWTFFQTSFLAAIDKWEIKLPTDVYSLEQQHDMIEKGKSMRASFEGMTDEIRAYNELEIALLEQLMTEFRNVLRLLGYDLTRWYGPGALAEAILTKHGVPKKRELWIMAEGNHTFRELANDAYYGGRFETTAIGPVAGPVYQYDINSAYPAAMRGLPCLLHGTWRQVRNRPRRGSIWIGAVHFDHAANPHDTNLYNLPVRLKDGNIIFPKECQGVYWSVELEAAEKAGTVITFLKGWVYEKKCDCQQFDFIQPIYDTRKRLGKSRKGFALKLGLNSLYGKFAQSIGNPQFANPVWAGLITAHCRAQIITAYTGHAKDVYMIATDGIFIGEKLDLPLGEGLGEWEETIHHDGMFLVQPGVYYLSSGGAKTRGIPFGRFHQRREDFELAWKRVLESGGENHSVDIEVDNFITARQALSRRKWRLAGSWERTSRKVSFWCAPKRDWTQTRYDGRAYRTSPPFGNLFSKSVPFAAIIGGTHRTEWGESRYTSVSLQESERYSEQPDWVEPMFAPTGGE